MSSSDQNGGDIIAVNNNVQSFSSDTVRHNVWVNSEQFGGSQTCTKHKFQDCRGVSGNQVRTRIFYNSIMDKRQVQGLLARGKKACRVTSHLDSSVVKNSRMRVRGFKANTSVVSHATDPTECTIVESTDRVSANGALHGFPTPHNENPHSFVEANSRVHTSGDNNGAPINKSVSTCDNKGVKSCNQSLNDRKCHNSPGVSHSHNGRMWGAKAKVPKSIDSSVHESDTVKHSTFVNNDNDYLMSSENYGPYALIYDVNTDQNGFGAELSNALFFKNGWKKHEQYLKENCSDFNLWSTQTDYQFGFVPLSNLVLPNNPGHIGDRVDDPIQQHFRVKATGIPNFLGARIPVKSQLNVEEWQQILVNYWDKQLIHLIQFGFPLDFNRASTLTHGDENHSSANDHPINIQIYLQEEIEHGAIIGPYECSPIPNCHISPFMTREKPNAPNRRVIINLSWPKENSVNAGVDKNSYLGSEFSLTFPTIDDITSELVKLGPGCHIYKVDISRAFRHLKIDPLDYDLLGLRWDATFIDTCLPFGSRHGSQNFQRISDAVRYALRCQGHCVTNYIDDFIGYGTPDVARRSYDCLRNVLERLGLTISEKKLVPPTTQAVCLGILIDTVNGTVSIPEEKLRQIKRSVIEWQHKERCSKRQLQSLLGQLLYIHKCVRPARLILNRMLDLLRQNYDASSINLTQPFKRDLRWFTRFLENYNGVSMYTHRKIDHVVELDACLDGLGAVWKNYVYHLPIPSHYFNLTIVHLEMINILVAIKPFGPFWAQKKVLVKCDNQAVVSVLRHSRTKDAFLAACARNIWLLAAWYDLEMNYVHIKGKENIVADLLSRWRNTPNDILKLHSHIADPLWLQVPGEFLDLDNEI